MWIEELPNGKCKYIERYEDPYTGKLKRVSVTRDNKTRQTQKEAQYALNNKIAKRLNSVGIATTMTFKQLYDEWYQKYKFQVTENTYLQTKNSLRKIIEAIGANTLIDKIDAPLLNKVFDDCIYNEGFSNRYVAILKSKVNLIFKFALKKGYLKNNPISNVVISYKPTFENKKVRNKFLEDEEYNQLVSYLESHNERYAILCQWLYLTGMRAGEALALQKSDIYKKDDTYRIKITGTLMTRGRQVKDFKKSDRTKTPAGMRDIKLPIKGIVLYERLLKLNPKGTFLFQTSKGTPFQIQPINRYFKIHQERMGISLDKTLSTHIFRHTHISKLAELGVPLPVIQDRVGHEDSKITQQIYLHVTKKMKEQLDNDIDKL